MLDELYEVSDQRSIPLEDKLTPVVMLENVPGGINVWELDGKSQDFQLTEDNFDWTEMGLTLWLDTGLVHFSPLTEHSTVLPFLDSEDFSSLRQDILR